MRTLVIDTGTDIVGIYNVSQEKYIAYTGKDIPKAIKHIQTADEVVTYSGTDFGQAHSDLKVLGKFSGIDGVLPLKGIRTDMRIVIWSDRIWGSNLQKSYYENFSRCKKFPDTYEGGNECDVHMTYKLWKQWRAGKLKRINGGQPL